MVQLPHLVHGPIKEIPVVRDHQYGGGKVGQEAFQPGQSLHVQMVGGLIQDQKIGFAEQGLGQSSPGPFSSAGLGSRRF